MTARFGRRGLLTGLLAAPLVTRLPRLLMPTRSWSPVADALERPWARGETLARDAYRPERGLVLPPPLDGVSAARWVDLTLRFERAGEIALTFTATASGTLDRVTILAAGPSPLALPLAFPGGVS